MADPFATPDDYTARTGQTLDSSERVQVTTLLEEASELIREHSPGIDARITAENLAPTLATGICVRVVQRYMANPTQAAARTTGPFTVSWSGANTRGLWITEDELATLNGPATASTTARGVGSVRLATVVGTARQGRCLPPWR